MDEKKEFKCTECELHYEDETTALRCEAWCAATSSCNLDITKLSIEASAHSKDHSDGTNEE